jgi:hypothetical protein
MEPIITTDSENSFAHAGREASKFITTFKASSHRSNGNLRCIERCADACTPMNRPLLLLALDELTYIHVSTSFIYPILKKVPLGRVPQEPMCKKE